MRATWRGVVFVVAVCVCRMAGALVVCGACGHEAAEGQTFCGHCGVRVGAESPRPESTQEAPATDSQAAVAGVDEQVVLEAAREDSRAAAELEETLPEVALCYYRNAAALSRLVPDGILPDEAGKRLVEAVGRCQKRMSQTLKPCTVCTGTGRRTVRLQTLTGGTEGDLRGEGLVCTACNGAGRVKAARNADELRLLLAQGVRNHETRQQAARRVAVGNVWVPVVVSEKLTPRLQALLRTAAASPCSDCQGLGVQVCDSCKGQGRTACKQRGCADGMVDRKPTNTLTPATALTVKAKCPACNGNTWTACTVCSGKGHVVCQRCDGLGQPKKCIKCGGAGTGRCTQCKGTGKDRSGNPCAACAGEGLELCKSCHGEGCVGR